MTGPLGTSRIDTRTNSVTARIQMALKEGPFQVHQSGDIAAADDAVWVADVQGDDVWEIDPTRNLPLRTIPVGDGPTGVAVDDASVWVANTLEGTLSRIDPSARRVVETIEVGGTPRGVAVADGLVWIAVG